MESYVNKIATKLAFFLCAWFQTAFFFMCSISWHLAIYGRLVEHIISYLEIKFHWNRNTFFLSNLNFKNIFFQCRLQICCFFFWIFIKKFRQFATDHSFNIFSSRLHYFEKYRVKKFGSSQMIVQINFGKYQYAKLLILLRMTRTENFIEIWEGAVNLEYNLARNAPIIMLSKT